MNTRALLRRSRPGQILSGIVFTLIGLTSAFAQSASREPASNGSANADDVVKLETFQVTGTALRSQEEVENRRVALNVADTLTMDELGNLADENLADALIRLPGISTMQTLYGEQEASYVSVRGIPADLSYTSFDGMTMFSTANDGDGLRRVDLNLIPTQISRTTRVYKSFTADLDAGAIGGVTNIEPYSALKDKRTANIRLQLTGETGEGKYIAPFNSRGGHYRNRPISGAMSALYVNRFGRDGRFGVVLSGIYRQRDYSYTKTNPNGRVFYTTTGATAAADLSNWDGKQPFPTIYRPMDYTKYSESRGGSAKFEYRLSDAWSLSLLGFDYKKIEDQNLNQFYLETFTALTRPSEQAGRFKIGRNRSIYSYDRFQQGTRGLLFKAEGKLSSDSSLEIRAGSYQNEFYDRDESVTFLYSPTASFITFDYSDRFPKVTIEGVDPMVTVSNYRLSSAPINVVESNVDSKQAKIDYKKNYFADSSGFGFTTGADWRETEARRDATTTNYTNNSAPLTGMGFVPDFQSVNYAYPVVWVDYTKFQQTVLPTLAINQTTTNNDSWSGDYFYKEQLFAAYVSAKYGWRKTNLVAGVRYDKVDYDARSPLATGTGTYNGTFTPSGGTWENVLPSAILTHYFTPRLRAKAAFSKSLGRPQFGEIAQAVVRNDQNLTITRGNPNLKPRRSDNYDLALEYFFNKEGMIAISGFSKNIKDDIYTQTVDEVIDGLTYAATQPYNSSSSKMKGVEIALTHNAIPGLPGFLEKRVGVALNYTKLWGEMDYLSGGTTYVHLDSLQYQPDYMANATVFYQLPRKKGEIRVSYNWKGKSPISLGLYPWTTYWLRESERLDIGARYSLTKNFILKLQVSNLTGQGVKQGYLAPYAQNRYEMNQDRTYSLDLIYKF